MRGFLILFLFLTGFAFQFAHANLRQVGHFRPQTATAPVGETWFLGLSGTLNADEEPEMLLAKLSSVFHEPLQTKNVGLFSYIMEVRGREFYMNFIAEPAATSKSVAFAEFISKLEGSKVRGELIHFKRVTSLHEVATFQAGNYVGAHEDPFAVHFELARNFIFTNLRGWYDFTEGYGGAFSSNDNSVFRSYMEKFIGDKKDYEQVSEVLRRSNMAAVDPRVSLTLEDGSTVDSQFEHTPFIPFKFFRRCLDEKYENGNCYQ